jgi:rhodanese-related sulfurtransferase
MRFISPATLWQFIKNDSDEYAIIDVRGEGSFAEGHLLLASNAPLSRLELIMPALVPRRATQIILCDDDDRHQKLSLRAIETLSKQHYVNLHILQGGITAWKEAGFELYAGVHVLSKAFGEYIEEKYETPHITATSLVQALDSPNTSIMVVDSRPQEEFSRMSVPGAINIPGAELVHRIQELVPNSETLVVVNCAGRTRSIIGAQSLINAGLDNPVVALENGTMGWHLSGLPLATGQKTVLPTPKIEGCKWARSASQEVARRASLKLVDWETLCDWNNDETQQTFYLFDVRTPQEFHSGHLPGSGSAPGGQLVQATDKFIGTHGAKIILTCNNGTRAKMTASWLVQMGLSNVFVLSTNYEDHRLEQGSNKTNSSQRPLADPTRCISVKTLATTMSDTQTTILDFANSREYKRGHIPEAWFAVRSDLDRCLNKIPECDLLVLTSPSGEVAALACDYLVNRVEQNVVFLDGGTKSWVKTGHSLTKGAERMMSPENDVYKLPYDYDPATVEKQMKAYLEWETGLLDRIKKDTSIHFVNLHD